MFYMLSKGDVVEVRSGLQTFKNVSVDKGDGYTY